MSSRLVIISRQSAHTHGGLHYDGVAVRYLSDVQHDTPDSRAPESDPDSGAARELAEARTVEADTE